MNPTPEKLPERRPAFLVPGSLVEKWHGDRPCRLPDYRFAVIGADAAGRLARRRASASSSQEPQTNMAAHGPIIAQMTPTPLTEDERQRGLTCEKYEVTRPSGETFTMYHLK